uniref:Uncharacterized protein n=1 Tax=Arundo donax TaxID=35708 RepID=A0A0A9F9P4_ARUDO
MYNVHATHVVIDVNWLHKSRLSDIHCCPFCTMTSTRSELKFLPASCVFFAFQICILCSCRIFCGLYLK